MGVLSFFTWDQIQNTLFLAGKWFALFLVVFVPLAKLMPCNKEQPVLRRGIPADLFYWFFASFLYRPVYFILTVFLLTSFYSPQTISHLNGEGLPPIKNLPIWFQAFLMLLATDILQYWAHRLFHHMPLWRFHAVHHAPKHIDFMTSVRFHPVNLILYSTLMNSIVYLAGFSPAAFAELFLFNMVYSPLVHANLNWTYGPFRYVLASPVFHRWHHTQPDEGGNKNFAPTFPFLDLMFGTFYMPEGQLPANYGAPYDPVPDDVIGQLAYPFRRTPAPALLESPQSHP